MVEVVEQYVAIWNSNSIVELENVFTNQSQYWDALQEGPAIEILKNSIQTTHSAFPGISFEIIDIKDVRKESAYLEWRMQGSHQGEFLGVAPTWNKINIRGLDAINFSSNKISRIQSYFDSYVMLKQLGIVT